MFNWNTYYFILAFCFHKGLNDQQSSIAVCWSIRGIYHLFCPVGWCYQDMKCEEISQSWDTAMEIWQRLSGFFLNWLWRCFLSSKSSHIQRGSNRYGTRPSRRLTLNRLFEISQQFTPTTSPNSPQGFNKGQSKEVTLKHSHSSTYLSFSQWI